MKKTIDSKYSAAVSLASLCEYMYRKGIKDAAETFDENTIRCFLESNDPKTTLVFMFDENGKNLRPQFYAALMSVRCHTAKTKAAAILFDYGAAKPALVHGACALVNAFYRKGLEDGIGVDLGDANSFINNYQPKIFERIHGGTLSIKVVMAEMLSEAMRLDSDGFTPGFRIWKFINDGIIIHGMKGTFIYDEDDH